jgi:DDE superfamily endonuclease
MSDDWWRCNPRLVSDDKLLHLTGLDRELFDRLVWLLEPLWEDARARRIEQDRDKKKLVRRNRIGAGKPPLPFPSRLFVVLMVLRTNMPLRTVEAHWGVGKDLVSRSTRQIVELLAGLGVTGPGGERLDGEGLASLLASMAGPGGKGPPAVVDDSAEDSDHRPPSGSTDVPLSAGEPSELVGGSEGVAVDGWDGVAGGVIIDGTYTRVGRPRGWEDQKRLYNSHRGCHCLVYQGCCDLDGNLLWVSAPFPGATHDLTALTHTPLAALLAQTKVPVLFDKGYQGVVGRLGLHAERVFLPRRKPPGNDLPAADRNFNRLIASLRIKIEHVNEQLKNWKILGHYRGRHANFGHVLQAVAVLLTLPHRTNLT